MSGVSAALEPLPGDPVELAGAAERLGSVAAATRAEAAMFHEGSRLATLAVLRSDAAPRITDLSNGLRGVVAEYSRLESSGVLAARALAAHARAWRAVEDELEALRDDVRRADRAAAHAVEAAAAVPVAAAPLPVDPAITAAPRVRDDAESRARELKHSLLTQRAALVAEIRALIGGYDASWVEVPAASIAHAALETPMHAIAARMSAGTASVDDGWTMIRDAYGEVGDDDSRAWRSSVTYQIFGGFDEFGTLLKGSVTGTGHAITHPIDTFEGVARLGWDFSTDPYGTGKTIVQSIYEPYVDELRAGEQGRAVGRGAEAAFEIFLGAKGATKSAQALKDSEWLGRLRTARADRLLARKAVELRDLGTPVSEGTWSFASEKDAARALANAVPASTYRVHCEDLPTDYVVDNDGRLRVVRGPKVLLRQDVPVPSAAAREMADRLAQNRWEPLDGFYSGGTWKNLPGSKNDSARLPVFDSAGKPITFTEYDVNPFVSKPKRGKVRLVHDSTGRTWYTDDHYQTFVQLR